MSKRKDSKFEEEARFRRIVDGIKEFGYSNVTDEEVKEAIDSLNSGKEPQNVLEMFISKIAKQRKDYA